jgi:hypothetical protein
MNFLFISFVVLSLSVLVVYMITRPKCPNHAPCPKCPHHAPCPKCPDPVPCPKCPDPHCKRVVHRRFNKTTKKYDKRFTACGKQLYALGIIKHLKPFDPKYARLGIV